MFSPVIPAGSMCLCLVIAQQTDRQTYTFRTPNIHTHLQAEHLNRARGRTYKEIEYENHTFTY